MVVLEVVVVEPVVVAVMVVGVVVVVVTAPVVVVPAPVVVVTAPVVVVVAPVVVVVTLAQGSGEHVPGPRFAPPALEHCVAVSTMQVKGSEEGRVGKEWRGD